MASSTKNDKLAVVAAGNVNKPVLIFRHLWSFEIRFDSAVPIRFDSKVRGRFENFRIGRACPLLVVVKRLKPLTALSGTVYRLASSMSDHTPVLFNVFEDWIEEYVAPHISFDSILIWFECKQPIRRPLVLSGVYEIRFDPNRNARFDSRFDSNANSQFAGPYIYCIFLWWSTKCPNWQQLHIKKFEQLINAYCDVITMVVQLRFSQVRDLPLVHFSYFCYRFFYHL